MDEIADFTPWLREVVDAAKCTGLRSAALELESRAFAAYTTSSEWLGETSEAIALFRSQTKGSLPLDIEAKLRACDTEISKVWPALK